jgi:hypothetical protein
MWRRQKALAALYDELRTIQVFDRLHDYSANGDPADNEAYAVRRARRAQITAEIEKLKQSKSHKDSHKQRAA